MVNDPASAWTSGVAAGVPVIPATDYLEAIGDSKETVPVTRETRNSTLRLAARFARMRALFASFRSNTRANVAVISAVSALPLITAIGCVVDYTTASMIRTKLQGAADAATLASVSANSPLMATAKAMTGNGNVSGGSTATVNFFNSNLTGTTGYTTPSPTANVTKTGMVISATLSFTAQVPTFFLGVIGYRNIAISGTSTSSYKLPTYIDFYLTIDVSGSMSFPSTASEQARLQAVNPDNMTGSNGYPKGCTFACHFAAQRACPQAGNPGQGPYPAVGTSTNPSPGGYCQGFIITRLGTTPVSFASGNNSANGLRVNWTNSQVTSCPNPGTTSCIQLRADAVGYAVNQLLSTANSSEQVTNQFRVGLYPFIVNLYSYFPLTTSLNGSANTSGTINYAAANLATLLDTGNNASLGSGGTHFENAFTSMNNLISSVGTGSSTSNTLPYVFLITDGSQDCQTQWNGSWSGNNSGCSPYYNSSTTIDTSNCTTLKNRGITIAVLYIPYQTIQNPTTFSNSEDIYANSNIPNIPGALQSCASPNFYYTANTPTDITSALIAMFEQAVSTAHVTN
jgi:Flp pilus assembly protein TadG